MKKKVLITTSNFSMLDNLSGMDYILNPYKRKLSTEELINLLQIHKPDYIIAGTENINKNALELMKPYVKLISRCGIGIDSVDVIAAQELSIDVANTPDAPTMPVAELTLGVMLDLCRKISFADRSIRNGVFEKPMGSLLHGKTIGIIGCGRIGTHLAHLLQNFECKIIGFDPIVNSHNTIHMVPASELLENSDLITLHIPFTPENRHIADAEFFKKMKKTAYLLNLSRGGLVDEDALADALDVGQIAGAGIDCFENEPYQGKLTKFDNVVLTTHIGSYAREARERQELDAIKNILEWRKNHE